MLFGTLERNVYKNMKRRFLVTAVLAVLCIVMSVGAFAAVSFNDTKGHWAEATILELAEKGIINGKGEGIYDPQGTVTRAEFMKLLVCALNEYNEEASFGEGTLADVYKKDWYYGYVASGLENNIFSTSDLYFAEFLPKEGMSRADVAVWITNGLGITTEGECTFTDVTDAKVKKAVTTANLEGLITGYEDNTYRPEKTLTRAEAAVIVKRVMEKDASFNTLRESKNEVKYSDGLITVKYDGVKNIIKSTDESTKTVVIENCSAEILGCKTGDVFFIEPWAEYPTGFLVKVKTIAVDGTTATIVCDQPKLEDVFKSIDIAQKLSMSADNYIPGSSSYGIEVSKADSMKTKDGRVIAGSANELILFEISSNATGNLLDIYQPFEEGRLSGYLSLKSDVIADISLDIGWGKADFSGSVKVETIESAELKYEYEASYEKKWDLGSFSVPIYGPISANVDVDLLFTAEGRFEVVASAYAQSDIGLKYQKGKISMINDNKSSVSLTAEAEGEIRLGPTLTVGVGIDPPLVDPINVFDVYGNLGVGIHAETGIEHVLSQENGDASYKAHNNTPDKDGNIHICDVCVDGNVFLFLTGDAGISSDVTDLLECGKLRVDFGEVQKNITDWYFSISTKNDKIGKFGLGTCPNVYRPIKFTKQPAGVKASMGTAVKLEAKAGAGKNGTDKETQKIVYKWYKDGKEIANEFSNVLTIKSAAVEDSGTYTCKAYYSALGEEVLFADSKEAKVEVTAFDKGPEITKQPENVTVDEGFGVSMSVSVKAPEGAMVEFQWYKNGAAIANATASSYSIAAADKSSEGTYYCIAKISGFDNLATKSASATLTVKTKADKEKENQDGVLDTDIFGGNNTSLEGLEGKKPANDGGVLDTDIFG